MVVITNEKDIVQEVALIPGNVSIPSNWHCYFPLTEAIPVIGTTFIPDFELQPWLVVEKL